MDKLPVEILHQIFIKLPAPQKRECTFVCKQWAGVVFARSLFHTVMINNNKVFRNFIDMIECLPFRGTQVEHLGLFHCIQPAYDTRKLFSLMPNLKTIILGGEVYSPETEEEVSISSTNLEVNHRRSQLAIVSDYNECIFTRFLIQNNMCNHLVSLTLSFDRNSSASTTLSMLMHMPILRDLDISSCSVSFGDFENIHDNLPSLKKIAFGDVDIVSSTLPQNIVPATSIQSIHVNMEHLNIHHLINWCRYITRKYPNLQHLDFFFYRLIIERVQSYYIDGFEPLLKHLGPQLRTITLTRPEYYPNIIKHLDEYGCQVRYLTIEGIATRTILKELENSRQSNYIKELLLRVPISSLQWLKKMAILKKLTINYSVIDEEENRNDEEFDEYLNTITVDLNQLGRFCPESCENISVIGGVSKFNLDTKEQYHFKKLSLENVAFLPLNFNTFITDHLPLLNSLTLIGCLVKNSVLNFPKHHFSYVNLDPSSDEDDIPIGLELLTHNKGRSFYAKNATTFFAEQSLLESFLLPLEFKDVSVENTVTLKCASVEKLFFNGPEVYMVSDFSNFKSLKY